MGGTIPKRWVYHRVAHLKNMILKPRADENLFSSYFDVNRRVPGFEPIPMYRGCFQHPKYKGGKQSVDKNSPWWQL